MIYFFVQLLCTYKSHTLTWGYSLHDIFCEIDLWISRFEIHEQVTVCQIQKLDACRKFEDTPIWLGQTCLPRVSCLWSKMPMFQGVGMKEGGESFPLAFQYLILMIWRHCDLNLVMISLLASKCQDFKVEMPVFQPFYDMKLKTNNFKVLTFCSQWRYHDQIQITRSSYHKNQILKC